MPHSPVSDVSTLGVGWALKGTGRHQHPPWAVLVQSPYFWVESAPTIFQLTIDQTVQELVRFMSYPDGTGCTDQEHVSHQAASLGASAIQGDSTISLKQVKSLHGTH